MASEIIIRIFSQFYSFSFYFETNKQKFHSILKKLQAGFSLKLYLKKAETCKIHCLNY